MTTDIEKSVIGVRVTPELKKMLQELEESGRAGAELYFDWFDNWSAKKKVKPFNLP